MPHTVTDTIRNLFELSKSRIGKEWRDSDDGALGGTLFDVAECIDATRDHEDVSFLLDGRALSAISHALARDDG